MPANYWTHGQARQEPQRGLGKHSCWAPKHFHEAPLGRKFLNFSFQNHTFWRTLYFWPTAGSPNVAGPGVANPSTQPSRRACPWSAASRHTTTSVGDNKLHLWLVSYYSLPILLTLIFLQS